jgi:aromatic ring-opening dioxygenase catalytic subunit (LigB family)
MNHRETFNLRPMMNTSNRQPTFYLPHGGGPCFFMENTRGPAGMWDSMAAFLRGIVATLPEKPKAVVIVSGHWEERAFAVNTAANPPLLFDYYGFPEHTYHLKYPAPGSPALAQRVRGLLEGAGLATSEDAERGLDHGVFIPFMLVLPDADVPVVEISLRADLNPAVHLQAGAALAPLRDEGVMVVGTGMSFHNMRMFGPGAAEPSKRFDAWLTETVTATSANARNNALIGWEGAPAARASHPREEHLLPLMVAAGAAGADLGVKVFEDQVLGATVSAFRFG